MKVELTVPRSYAELNEKQLRYIASLQLAGSTSEDICVKCFIRFSGIRAVGKIGNVYYFVNKKVKGFFTMNLEELVYFSKKMEWITKNHIGIQPVKCGKFKPVDKWLRDTTFLQYVDAENYYQAFIHTNDEQYLYKMMAVLYHPAKRYINLLTHTRNGYFKKRTDVEKHLVMMWMVGVKSYFSKKFTYLFARESVGDQDEITFPDMAEIINNQLRILTIGDITKRQQVLDANTIDALSELNEKCREYEELKKK